MNDVMEMHIWKKMGHTRIEFWEGPLGHRWFWHKKVNGRITQSGNYASRRSCRRALRRIFGDPD